MLLIVMSSVMMKTILVMIAMLLMPATAMMKMSTPMIMNLVSEIDERAVMVLARRKIGSVMMSTMIAEATSSKKDFMCDKSSKRLRISQL